MSLNNLRIDQLRTIEVRVLVLKTFSVRGIKPKYLNKFTDSEVNSDSEQATGNNLLKVQKSRECTISCALTEHHAMEAYWGSRGIAPLIR